MPEQLKPLLHALFWARVIAARDGALGIRPQDLLLGFALVRVGITKDLVERAFSKGITSNSSMPQFAEKCPSIHF